MLLRLVTMTILTTAHFGCHHGGKLDLNPNEAVVVDNLLRINGDKLTLKKTKYAVQTYVTNLSKKPIIFRLSEILCYRGKDQGILGHARFGAGERVIDFAAGQQKRFLFGCTFGERAPTGPIKIVFTKVYENQNGDGASFGKLLKEDITWNIAEPSSGKQATKEDEE